MLALALDMKGVGMLALARYERCWDVSSGSIDMEGVGMLALAL